MRISPSNPADALTIYPPFHYLCGRNLTRRTEGKIEVTFSRCRVADFHVRHQDGCHSEGIGHVGRKDDVRKRGPVKACRDNGLLSEGVGLIKGAFQGNLATECAVDKG